MEAAEPRDNPVTEGPRVIRDSIFEKFPQVHRKIVLRDS